MQYKQKKLIKKILLFIYAAPFAFFLLVSLVDKTTAKNYYLSLVNLTPFNKVSLILFLLLIAGTAAITDEIISGEVSASRGTGGAIKKGETGYHLVLCVHIFIFLSILLLFTYEQFY